MLNFRAVRSTLVWKPISKIWHKFHLYIFFNYFNKGFSTSFKRIKSLKLKKSKQKVWVFVGDMTYETGTFIDCYKYAKNFGLPLNFIVEDNNMSTNTPTDKAWGKKMKRLPGVIYYKYSRKFPHHGTGTWVLF